MENHQNPTEGNTPGQQGNNKNNDLNKDQSKQNQGRQDQGHQNEDNQNENNENQNKQDQRDGDTTHQGDGDKFRKHESEDDHRDIPEIGEDEKEIERNTPRM